MKQEKCHHSGGEAETACLEWSGKASVPPDDSCHLVMLAPQSGRERRKPRGKEWAVCACNLFHCFRRPFNELSH